MPLRRAMPALLTRTETCPILSAIFLATATQSSRRVTSRAKLSALPPASREFQRRLGRGFLVHIEQHHPRGLAGIAERDRAPDAGACAGDDSNVVLEKGHGRGFLCFWF